MGLRASLNQVGFRVRSAMLTEGQCTAAQIVALTGLKQASVRTELQRLKKQGYVTGHSLPRKTGKRGRPPVQYQLSSDPAKRADLAESIHLFDPLEALAEQPTSIHYDRAVAAFNRAFELSADDRRGRARERFLMEAEEHLKDARLAEGGKRASPAIKASLDLLLARIEDMRGRAAAALALVNGKSPVMVQEFKECQAWLSFYRQVAVPLSQGKTEDRRYAMSALEQSVRADSPSYPAMASFLKRDVIRT